MKKVIAAVMLCAFAMMGITGYAQSTKKQLKAERKVVEARVKELSADGWKSLQTAGLSMVISNHISKMNSNPDLIEFIGTAEGVRTTNLGQAKVRNNAIASYAEYCSGMLRARINSDLRDINGEQADNLVSGYERILANKLEKDLKPSYYIYQEAGNGMYNVRGVFLYDSGTMIKESNEALKKASEEAGLGYEYGNGISDFIKQGFNK